MNTGITPSTPTSTIQRNQRIRERRIARLACFWPRFSDENSVLPLPIGVQQTLIEDAKARNLPITEGQIKMGLDSYARRTVYLKALLECSFRFDLDLQPVEAISEEHKEVAKQRFSEIRQAFSVRNKKNAALKSVKQNKNKNKSKTVPKTPPKHIKSKDLNKQKPMTTVIYKKKRRTLTLPPQTKSLKAL